MAINIETGGSGEDDGEGVEEEEEDDIFKRDITAEPLFNPSSIHDATSN